MNGVLWKWTNYYSGWQPRWFVLKDGILSYYRSENEVQSGSKGSINLSVCDLNVSNFDNTRFEIIIPGEQKYHLKASNIQERQRWVVAIGSFKACHIEPEFEINARSSLNINLPIHEISNKESEMRLFQDLMNQQVMLIKTNLSENQLPNIAAINDITSTLNAACDTFLISLKDLMSIIALNSAVLHDYSVPPTHVGSPVFSSFGSNSKDLKLKRSNSCVSESRYSAENHVSRIRNDKSISEEIDISRDLSVVKSRRQTNFFFEMTHSFVDWSSVVETNHSISTDHYINSFWSLLQFLDHFNNSPITSLHSDITVHVKRLSQKYEADRDKFSTLEDIVKSENCSSQLNVESATYVIRSLNRGLMFIEYFLQYLYDWLVEGNVDDSHEMTVLKNLITRAYETTLAPKMNWLDQGQFTIITRSLPPLSQFLSHLLGEYDINWNSVSHLFKECGCNINQLIVDISTYQNSISIINICLSQFLSARKIEL